MKKKLLTAALSMVLCLGMSVTAMAAPSPSTATEKKATVNGKEVTVVTNSNPYHTANEAQRATLNKIFANVTTEATKADVFTAEFQKLGLNVEVVGAMGQVDVERPEGLTDEEVAAGVHIPFKADGVKAGEQVSVSHIKADGTKEPLTDAVATADGEITATFTSFSPVIYAATTDAVVAEKKAGGWSPEYYEQLKAEQTAREAAKTGGSAAVAQEATTSPKTQDTGVFTVTVLGMAAVVARLAISRKKSVQ